MKHKIHFSPFSLPILFFGVAILIGTLVLSSPASIVSGEISTIDALFTATSAACVTGLTVMDTGSRFTRFGQTVILCLIQLGGLGIMTFTGLIFYLWRRQVSLTDRIAVGQTLLHDPGFDLGRFLTRIVLWTLGIETAGALLIYIQDPQGFGVYSAVFHSISAFCNAGFSLYSDSLTRWKSHWSINLVFIALIMLGGMGFSVLTETVGCIRQWVFLRRKNRPPVRLTWYPRIVISTSLFLVLAGWGCIYLAEFTGPGRNAPATTALLTSLFQSVTCRTAGFNTLDTGQMTNVSLLVMIILMFIGGAPGSCAGGIKVTTFRALTAFAAAQIKGRQQARIGRFAIDSSTINKALVLLLFATIIVFTATLGLNITEAGLRPHPEAKGLYLEILFETISALGTVGLSTGLTPQLSLAGKCIITVLMFLGRLGPILFLAAIQSYQKEQFYRLPEESMLIG
jgi:trk system potassium uptake protein TrkH